MPFAGLDVHKKEVEAAIIDDEGRLVHRERFACTREHLIRFATKRLGHETSVVLESTTNTWTIVDVLQPLVKEVVVSNPMRTRAIAHAKIKTDKIDALVLAKLLRADFLPRVWCPDGATKERRGLCSRRAALVHDRTRVKNRIHAILHMRLIAPPVDDLFSTKGRMWLEQVLLDERARFRIASACTNGGRNRHGPFEASTQWLRRAAHSIARHLAWYRRRGCADIAGEPGTLQYFRPVPSLDSLYEREGLPPTQALANGEIHMLRKTDFFGYVEKINKEQRVRHRRQPENNETKTDASKTAQRRAKGQRKNAAGS